MVSALVDLDSMTLLAEDLMSEISSEGITRSARMFLDELDFLIDSIIEAIYLLKATYWVRALSLCSMISFFLFNCSFKNKISF